MNEMTFGGVSFREIPGHAGYYVSRCGDMLTTSARWEPKTRLLKQNPGNKRGYLGVTCGNRHVPVHRAVAMAWIPNAHGLPQVNHIDGNKRNNSVWNLEWCTLIDNVRHQLKTGLHARPEQPVIGVNPRTGDGVWARSLTEAEHFGFNHKNISACLRGKRHTHHGYQWSKAA